ncbi:MAG: Gfo/Idh/MocA family oxidoreductase [Planctomycetes bacterium]|nr:Gfo/Idh/MocA family oxidoreductase [Planctomycetota bacterium]
MKTANRPKTEGISRRQFLKNSATAASLTALTAGIQAKAYAAGTGAIKIGLIGCGGRGAGAAVQALNASRRAKLVAMADAFQDRLERSYQAISGKHPDRTDVPAKRRFVGMDAYAKVIDADVDMVLLTTPPGFRPLHFEAAVKANKHIFMEKPVAVDSPGIRKMIAANKQAKKKGLLVAVGLNIRHQNNAREVIKRIHDGAIGKITFLRAYGNNAGVWVRPRQPGQTEMEYQMRNWYYFNWLCGDLIVEQTVHALDLINWAMQDHPVEAQGIGGRQVRVGPDYGEIFDNHAVEYTYGDGTKMFLFCRHIRGCWNSFGGIAHGTKGDADISKGTLNLHGAEPLRFERGVAGHQAEHDNLFAALDAGRPYNEGDYGISSTMTAILGRMATYSGQVVKWDQAIKSDTDLGPKRYAWDAEAPINPGKDKMYPCAMPGITKPY